MSVPRYAAYKPSGVEWLGEVPVHWEVKAARFGYSIQLGKMLQPEQGSETETEVPYLKSQHVQWEAIRIDELPTMWASPTDEIKYGVKDGDLLVCEGGDVGRAGIVINPPPSTIIQNALHRVRSYKENNLRFLMYVLEHATSQSWFEVLCNRSTIAHFTGEKFGALRLPMPSLEEQQTIADFLDAQTAKIDTLLAKKQEFIDKLKEKRSALIARTVTRGLPPDAAQAAGLEPHPAMKDSGVEWLGQIPAYWQMKRLTSQFKSVGGGTPSKANSEFWDGDIPWVSPKDMSSRVIADTEDHITLEAVSESATRIVPPGVTLVVVRSGILRHTIPVATNLVAMALNQDMKALIAIGEVTNKYLVSFIEGHNRSLLNAWTKSGCTVESIESSFMLNTLLPIPPETEQQAIAAYLDRETARIDQLTAKVEAALSRLTEYRQALITAAVTGKIDVSQYNTQKGAQHATVTLS